MKDSWGRFGETKSQQWDQKGGLFPAIWKGLLAPRQRGLEQYACTINSSIPGVQEVGLNLKHFCDGVQGPVITARDGKIKDGSLNDLDIYCFHTNADGNILGS